MLFKDFLKANIFVAYKLYKYEAFIMKITVYLGSSEMNFAFRDWK